MKKYYLIRSKSNDYGACNKAVIYSEKKAVEENVYEYEAIPKADYEVLKKYIECVNDTDYEDFGYETLEEYLEEYF